MLSAPLVKTIAREHGIPVLQPATDDELYALLDTHLPDNHVTGVLVSYGKIVSERVIARFTPGIVNVHPSLLPRYRGPAPIEAAIVNGDQETGVTLMQLVRKMDAGPVYAFSPLELTGTETQPELYDTLGTLGANILVTALPEIMSGSITPKPQNDHDATYTSLLQKSDGQLDPIAMSAAEVERRIRGYLRFPKTKLTLGQHVVHPLKAHISSATETDDELGVRCADGKFVTIDTLTAPSGKRMTGREFLRGYRA